MTQITTQSLPSSNHYPITPFEHYMLADDRPSHSMAVQMRFWFSGHFQRGVFESALTAVLARHPIFQMNLQGDASLITSQIKWISHGKKVMPFICWKPIGEPITHPSKQSHIDLTTEIGLRIWVRDNATQTNNEDDKLTELLVQFHHSVCDGIGMLHFMEDLMIHYGIALGLPTPQPREIHSPLFTKRGDFGLSGSQWKQRVLKDLKRSFNFFRTLAQPLAIPPKQVGSLSQTAELFASERIVLPSSALVSIRSRARDLKCTVNDLLLFFLFKTLSAWNRKLGKIWLKTRIALAVSLRQEGDQHQSAVNIVSMVFLDKTHRQVQSPLLLKQIVDETTDVKLNRMGLTLPRVMRFLGRFPYAILIFMRFPLCSATAVLTNLGSSLSNSPIMTNEGCLRVGNLILKSYELLPPVRPKTTASFAINYYAGELSITIRYDSSKITRSTAELLLRDFSSHLDDRAVSTS